MATQEQLQLFNDGLNQFYKDKNKYVTTWEELVMTMSLEYGLMRPSEARAVVDELTDSGVLIKKDRFISFGHLVSNGKVKIPGTNNRRRTPLKPKSSKQRETTSREKSMWSRFMSARLEDAPDTFDEPISNLDDLSYEDYDSYLVGQAAQEYGHVASFSDEELMDYYNAMSGTDAITAFKRKRVQIRGKGYMMIPDDGSGHVPDSYLRTIQSKRSPKSIRMDGANRSKVVYQNPPSLAEGARWMRHPNRYDIEGIDAPEKQKISKPKVSKKKVKTIRRSKR